jgi:hypothetical protein
MRLMARVYIKHIRISIYLIMLYNEVYESRIKQNDASCLGIN